MQNIASETNIEKNGLSKLKDNKYPIPHEIKDIDAILIKLPRYNFFTVL